jgi:hypothetical protein
MADHAAVYQVTQVGIEGTAGTEAAANRRLRSMSIMFEPQAEIDTFRPAGQKYAALTALNREWMQASVEGEPTYTEIIYPLSSIINAGTAVGFGTTAAGTAYAYTFESNNTAADTFNTFTVQRGDSDRADLFTGGIFTDFEITVSREDSSITGAMLGRALVTGTALTSNPELLDLVPILPSQWDVYLDDDSASLGTTKLTRDFNYTFSISGRHAAIWPINSALDSYATTIESQEVAVNATLQLGADDVGMGMFDTMRAGATKFVRAEAIGGTTVGGSAFSLRIDAALQVSEAPSMEDVQELAVASWSLAIVEDADWGKAYSIRVVNEQSGY